MNPTAWSATRTPCSWNFVCKRPPSAPRCSGTVLDGDEASLSRSTAEAGLSSAGAVRHGLAWAIASETSAASTTSRCTSHRSYPTCDHSRQLVPAGRRSSRRHYLRRYRRMARTGGSVAHGLPVYCDATAMTVLHGRRNTRAELSRRHVCAGHRQGCIVRRWCRGDIRAAPAQRLHSPYSACRLGMQLSSPLLHDTHRNLACDRQPSRQGEQQLPERAPDDLLPATFTSIGAMSPSGMAPAPGVVDGGAAECVSSRIRTPSFCCPLRMPQRIHFRAYGFENSPR